MLSIDPKPEVVWSCSFSGRRIGPLGEPRDRWEKAAGGCLAGTSFRGTFPDAGETFRRELTKSRRQPGLNVFSEHNSEGWWDFLQGIDQKLKAVWSCTFSGYRSGSPGEPHDRWEKAAGGCLAGTSFRGTFPKAGVAFRRGSPQSWRQSGLNVFSEHNSEGWRDFLLSIDQKPKAVWSCTFSGRRIGSLGEPRDRCGKAAGGCLAGTSFRGTFPDAGETFCRELTKSRRLSGGNIFSGYISKGWSGFSQRISPKLEAAWPERLFRTQFRRLVGLFAEN